MRGDKNYKEGVRFLLRYNRYAELYQDTLKLNARASKYGLKTTGHLKSAAGYWLLEWEKMDKFFCEALDKIPNEQGHSFLHYKYVDNHSREEIQELMRLTNKEYISLKNESTRLLGGYLDKKWRD